MNSVSNFPKVGILFTFSKAKILCSGVFSSIISTLVFLWAGKQLQKCRSVTLGSLLINEGCCNEKKNKVFVSLLNKIDSRNLEQGFSWIRNTGVKTKGQEISGGF